MFNKSTETKNGFKVRIVCEIDGYLFGFTNSSWGSNTPRIWSASDGMNVDTGSNALDLAPPKVQNEALWSAFNEQQQIRIMGLIGMGQIINAIKFVRNLGCLGGDLDHLGVLTNAKQFIEWRRDNPLYKMR